ncbi:hypothetical protein TomTYG45_14600 [Sphingobium sp. TomTYG45]
MTVRVLPSPSIDVLKPLIGMGAWLAIPGIPVMIRSTPLEVGISFSEKVRLSFAGLLTVALAAGVEDSNFGCALAREGVAANIRAEANRVGRIVLNSGNYWSRDMGVFPDLARTGMNFCMRLWKVRHISFGKGGWDHERP